MNFFKKVFNEVKELDETIESLKETPEPEPKEEWIWVEGYKGTDINMCCRGYRYELGVQYDMPEGAEIEECKSGFHLCLDLNDVCAYFYGIGNGNRFFKVKALVRKSDKDKYRNTIQFYNGHCISTPGANKLAAKSIIFTSELTYDEILKDTGAEDLPEEYKKIAINLSIETAINEYRINTLVKDGYSKPFAAHIVNTNRFDIAHAISSQKDLSMDVKVLAILYEK